MIAVCYIRVGHLEESLRVALRLRWPDAEVVFGESEDELLDAAPGADVVFLDTNPAQPGFDLVRKARAVTDAGVVVLTTDASDEGILDGLEAGADDYITVPFTPALLVARVGALLRRVVKTAAEGQAAVRLGPLDLRPRTHEVYVAGNEVRLTPTEFNLLQHLAAARGGTMTAKALQKLIWECDEPLYLDTLRKYVQRLRKKLQQHTESDLEIVAVRGVGYRLAYRR